jgi:nonsense-mediated mRNA decay protein 3
MFCVECGAEGPTVEGLCPTCFAKKKPVLAPPAYVDVSRCQRCGSLRLASGWSKVDLELAIPQALREQVAILPPYRRASFTHVARPEDSANFFLTVKAVGRYEGLEVVQDFHTRLRLKPAVCETCQRRDGRYYEGILQVRAAARDLTPKEDREIRTFVAARADRGLEDGDFVSRTEDVRGGVDFYVSSNGLAARLAKDLAGTFGGTVASSPKLFGQREGKEVYRVTTLVRLPAFRIGDVVRYKGRLSEVLEVAPFVALRDLESGETRKFKPKDLRGATRLDAERFEAELGPGADGRIVAAHPESGAERAIRTKGVRGRTRGWVIWTQDEAYVSASPGDVSKS